MLTESVSYRKWKDTVIGNLIGNLHIEELHSLDSHLDDLLDRMEKYLQDALNKHAQLKYITPGT